MLLEYLGHFDLGPDEMCIFLVGFLEPEPFAHEGSDEVAVVAPPDVEAEGDRVKLYIQGPVEPIGVVEHEQEFPVFVHFLKDAVLSARKFKFPGRTHLQLVLSHLQTVEKGHGLLLVEAGSLEGLFADELPRGQGGVFER